MTKEGPSNACTSVSLYNDVNPRLVNEKTTRERERKRERERDKETKRERRCTGRERACDVGEATVHATRTNDACRRSGYMMREGMLFLAT